VITFPECPSTSQVTEAEYRNVVKYLVSIPPYAIVALVALVSK